MNDLVCCRCGITETERQKLPAIDTGIDNYQYRYTKSFSIGYDKFGRPDYVNKAWCPECHKEHELEQLMVVMDHYAKKHGETQLAKRFGITL